MSRRTLLRATAGRLVAGVALAAGVGGAWAYFRSDTTASGTIRTPTVTVTPLDTTQLGVTLTNRQPYLGTLKSFRVANSGDVEGAVTVRLTSQSDAAAELDTRLWLADPVMGCATEPASPATGSWRDTALEPFSLAPGATQTLCVTTALPLENRDAVAATSGAQTIPTAVSIALVGAGTGWTAHAEAAIAHATQAIYPLSSDVVPVADSQWFALRSASTATVCLDGTMASGTSRPTAAQCSLVEGYPAATQFWQLIPADGTDTRLVTLRPRHAPGMRLALDSASGTPILATADTASAAQRWYVQRTETGIQLVSAVDGRCLLIPPGTAVNGVSIGNCTVTGSSQLAFQRYPLLFETGLAGTTLTIGAKASDAVLKVQFLDKTTWRDLPELLLLAKIETRFAGVNLNTGLNQLRVVFPDGSIAYTLTVRWESATVYPVEGFE